MNFHSKWELWGFILCGVFFFGISLLWTISLSALEVPGLAFVSPLAFS